MRRQRPDFGCVRGASVEDPTARAYLARLEGRAYKSYRARESASRRLAQRARAWNWALVALSTSTTIASIGLLTDPQIYGPAGATLLVCLSILVLVTSLTTANIDYSARSRDMFLNYRRLQRIAVEMEELQNQESSPITAQAVKNMSDRYQALLDETENHTTADHLRHFSKAVEATNPYYTRNRQLLKIRKRAIIRERTLTSLPYITLIIPIALIAILATALAS